MTKSAAAAPSSHRIAPHDWISDHFAPAITVLSSNDADRLCAKNNLTFVELVQPFSKLLGDVTLKDPEGANHAVSSLNIAFQDFKKDPTRLVNTKLMSDLVSSEADSVEPMVSRRFGSGSAAVNLLAPGFTPWFDVWMKLYLQSIPVMEHEFFRHHLGCVFVVSTAGAASAAAAADHNPVETLRNLSQEQHKHQHEKPNAYPMHFSPNILKFYVLLHDSYECDSDSRAQELFTQMQTAFGSSACHLLQINSRNPVEAAATADAAAEQPAENVHNDEASAAASGTNNVQTSDYWFSPSHRFCNVESRLSGVGATVITTATSAAAASAAAAAAATSAPPHEAKAKSSSPALSSAVDHPLSSAASVNSKPDSPPPPSAAAAAAAAPLSKLKPVTRRNIAQCLNSNDVERIRLFVREFCIKGVIPHVEKCLRVLQELVSNRKNRSLFSGAAKRWFGASKPGAASGTSVVYSKEAPELQVRKLADLYFMFKLFKHAYACYHTAKRDFQSDEAWNYYAGCAEMSALSQFMQGDPTKKYPSHYMEDGITKYLQVCQMPEFAVRATLFDALCLKYLTMFQEAATSYIRLTNETKDARSSMLLEQAAYCYLLAQPPLIRKYAFYVILAGYRFSKSGQKKHSSRTYEQGFQVYRDKNWRLSEDHILYTLGHQSLLLKEHAAAADLFNRLFALPEPNANPVQQMCHLREFFIVHHLREKEDKKAAEITIPRFKPQECVLDLSCCGWSSNISEVFSRLSSLHRGDDWQRLEKLVADRVRGANDFGSRTSCQSVFGPHSRNDVTPQAVAGETITLMLPVQNTFLTPLLLKRAYLLWTFRAGVGGGGGDGGVGGGGGDAGDGDEPTATNADAAAAAKGACDFVKTVVVDSCLLEKSSVTPLRLELTPLRPGALTLIGVEFSLKAAFPQSEQTDYTIRGRQWLSVRGPRLSATPQHRTNVCYGTDNRLAINVLPPQPRLEASVTSWPDSMFCGELRRLDLHVSNVGRAVLANLHLVTRRAGLLSLGEPRAPDAAAAAHIFPLPVITDASLAVAGGDERTVDVLPVPHLRLEPGRSATLPLWIRAAFEPADQRTFAVECYYENDDAAAAQPQTPAKQSCKRRHRILTLDFSLKILPSLTLSALWSRACVFSNRRGRRTLTCTVSNASAAKDAAAARALDAARITRVSLLSRSHTLGEALSKSEGALINRDESALISFSSMQGDISRPTVDDGRSGNPSDLHFSSVDVAESNEFESIQLPPMLDFLKSCFRFPAKVKPELTSDFAALIYRGSASPSAVTGMLFARVRPDDDDDGQENDAAAQSTSRDLVDSSTERKTLSAPLTRLPFRIRAELSERHVHDFSRSRVCFVPFTVTVANESETAADFVYRTGSAGDAAADACRVLGVTDGRVPLAPGGHTALRFRAAVSAPGLFHLRTFRFQTLARDAPLPTNEAQDFWVPLDITFIVSRHSRTGKMTDSINEHV